ncbi:hypothetical protein [Actinomadura fibrosa]|uniref:Uncharacterized protein n=3 Tax=Actinomadura fibrosa TaxID=111802 RepID=A0ABW2XR98_9ACTN
MIELLFLGSAAFAGGAHATRRARHQSRPQPRRRVRDHSLLVKAWNSAGAPHTEETMLGDALADLGGRAIGSTVRRTAPRVRARGQRIRRGAESRWQRRRSEDRTVTFFRRRTRPTTGTAAAPGTSTGKRAGDAPPLPSGRTPPSLPAGRDPAAPRSPIPMPPGRAPGGTGGSGRGRAAGPARTGRRGRAGRARSRLRGAVPLNLEAPGTDVEFLDACADLLHMLRAVGVAVQDWTEEVSGRRLPSVVTGPLDTVSEGLVDGAACAALATMLFENWFAEAREVAAAGIEFTGDDPE